MLLGLISAVCLAQPRATSAAGRIAIVAEAPAAPLARRVGAELQARGYEVVYLSPLAGDEALSRLRHQSLADAVLRLFSGRTPARLLFVDRESREETERPVESEATDERTLALKIAEVLRASLLVLPPGPPPPSSPVATASGAASGESFLNGRALVAAAVLRGLETPHGTPAVRVEGGVTAGAHLSLSLTALLPLQGGNLQALEGNALTHTFGAGVSFAWAGAKGALRPFADAGLGARWTRASGSASSPYEGATATSLAAAAELGVGVRWKVAQRWAVEPRLGAAVWLPQTVVRFAGRSEARLGLPELSASLGFAYEGAP